MYPKYMMIIQELGSEKPFLTVREYDDANEALAEYFDYYEQEQYDIALYRILKHDYNNL